MADFYDDIAAYLETAGVGTRGTNIFVAHVPDDPDETVDNCIVLLGSAPETQLNADVAALLFPRFQIYVRNEDYNNGSTKLQAVRTALHAKIGVQLTNYYVLRIHADQEGGPIGRDPESGLFEFSINFTAEARAQTA